mgnify:CR=1 FL=1
MSTTTNTALAKYNAARRYDGIQPRVQSTAYPAWWAYDPKGEWVMVAGEKVPTTASHIGNHLVNLQFFAGKDETGYYIKDYYGNGPTYLSPKNCLAGWGDAEWWAYAQTLQAAQEKARNNPDPSRTLKRC